MALFPMTFPFYFAEIPAEVPPGNQVIAGARVRVIMSGMKINRANGNSRIYTAGSLESIRNIYAGKRIIGA